MKIELNQPHLSIKKLATVDLPDFTVLIGRNGVGKTHLLEAIKSDRASITGIPISEIEKYDIQSFQPTESKKAGWDGVTFAQKTVEKYFSTPSDSAPVNIAKKVFLESLDELNPGDGFEGPDQFESAIRRGNFENAGLCPISQDEGREGAFHVLPKDIESSDQPFRSGTRVSGIVLRE